MLPKSRSPHASGHNEIPQAQIMVGLPFKVYISKVSILPPSNLQTRDFETHYPECGMAFEAVKFVYSSLSVLSRQATHPAECVKHLTTYLPTRDYSHR